MQIALCQFNPVVGAVISNSRRICAFAQSAKDQGASLLIAPELAICGYSPKDLLFRDDFLSHIGSELAWLSQNSPIPVILGSPVVHRRSNTHSRLHNAAVLCYDNKVQVVARKQLIPNYDVFDEWRYFEPAVKEDGLNVFELDGIKFGFSICEDAWNDSIYWSRQRYKTDPIQELVNAKVDVIVNISASPFTVKKPESRDAMFAHLAKRHEKPLIMVGQVGANDQWIFDGSSAVYDSDGMPLVRVAPFVERIEVFDLYPSSPRRHDDLVVPFLSEMESLKQALSLGIRDYVEKCDAKGILIGISGGIDSALVAALAVEAVGPGRVIGFRLPSKYSSTHSLIDAQELADNLGIDLKTINIEDTVDCLRKTVENGPSDITDQNLQARARGVILMAYSNETGYLLLATGNKSEMSVGYATLYGDLCGALAPIADVYKTDVWELAKHFNKDKIIIPNSIIEKPPSAELKANQKDEDSLLPYPRLDAILRDYIDHDLSVTEIASKTQEKVAEVEKIVAMVHRSEYKRRQIPLSLRVTERVFGDGRRWPVANRINH